MRLTDEWLNRKSLAEDFQRAMAAPQERKGNPDETIDYEKLPSHLRDDSPYVQCNSCGRKSYEGTGINERCNLTRPSGHKCTGFLLSKT